MKNAFYFTLKALFIHNIFKFCPAFFGPLGQRLDTKARINLKLYEVRNSEPNNFNILIDQVKAIMQSNLFSWQNIK